jgi:hypothetical protein
MAAKSKKAKPVTEAAPTDTAAVDAAFKAATKGIKMVKRHKEYQEPDPTADAFDGSGRFTGSNPYPAGTAKAQGWEILKKSEK